MRANLGSRWSRRPRRSRRRSRGGGKLLVFGNGGSAADAQHMAAELVGRFQRERAALAAIALTTDTSIADERRRTTTRSSGCSRGRSKRSGSRGDVAFGISTSGESRQRGRRRCSAASARGLKTIALTGRDGGAVGARSRDPHQRARPSTARVQEVHRTLIHVMCEVD